MTTTADESVSRPFPDGFPVSGEPGTLLSLLEDVLRQRAMERGITDVALSDAKVPVTGALDRNTLLPVLVDYANHIIFTQTELTFDSEFMDSMVMATMSDPESPEASTMDEARSRALEAQAHTVSEVQSPLFYNANSGQAALGYAVRESRTATIPASVSILMMDTALEMAHEASIRGQTSSTGLSSDHTLDLTFVADMLSELNVKDRVVVPRALHNALEKRSSEQTAMPITHDDPIREHEREHESHNKDETRGPE